MILSLKGVSVPCLLDMENIDGKLLVLVSLVILMWANLALFVPFWTMEIVLLLFLFFWSNIQIEAEIVKSKE